MSGLSHRCGRTILAVSPFPASPPSRLMHRDSWIASSSCWEWSRLASGGGIVAGLPIPALRRRRRSGSAHARSWTINGPSRRRSGMRLTRPEVRRRFHFRHGDRPPTVSCSSDFSASHAHGVLEWIGSDRRPAAPRSSSRNVRRQLFSAAYGFASRNKKSRRRPPSTPFQPYGCGADRPRSHDHHRGRDRRG